MKNLKSLILLLLCFTLASAQNIVKMEYWIDSDPGFDSATLITGFAADTNISNFTFPVPANLSVGVHTVGVRSKDANGKWSHTNLFPVLILDTTNAVVTEIEYFWDVDPGFGNATDTVLTVSLDSFVSNISVLVPDTFQDGSSHILFVRTKESRGRWSHTNYAANITVRVCSIAASVSGDSIMCSGNQVTLTASGGSSYTWNNGLGNNSSVNVSPASTTTYNVIVSDSIGCSDTTSHTVTVLQPTSSQQSNTLCSGESILFGGQTLSATGTYRDTLVNTVGCDSISTLNLTVLSQITGSDVQTICNDSFYVFNGDTLSVSDTYYDTLTTNNGCDSVVTLTLMVEVCTGIENLRDDFSIMIYPNPTNSVLNVKVEAFTNETVQLVLLNTLGQEMIQMKINAETTQIDLSKLSEGMYFLRTEIGSVIKSFKIQKH